MSVGVCQPASCRSTIDASAQTIAQTPKSGTSAAATITVRRV
jgi:hypothetical protein